MKFTPNSLKGRPIIARPNSPIQRSSSLLEKILIPLIPKLKSERPRRLRLFKEITEKFIPKLDIFNVRYS